MSTSETDAEAPGRPPVSFGSPTPTAADRWQVTVSAPTLAILAAAAVVLLAVVFSAGRHYESLHPSVSGGARLAQEDEAGLGTDAQDGSGADIDASRAGQVAKLVSGSDQTSGATDAASAGPSRTSRPQVTLQKGYHYIVVQHFGKKYGQEAALTAAEFLQDNGVPCATLIGADIRLVVTEPFLVSQTDRAAARRARERADRLVARIKQLGQQFNKELLKQGKKGYTFSGCKLVEIK